MNILFVLFVRDILQLSEWSKSVWHRKSKPVGVKLPDFIVDAAMYCSFRGYRPSLVVLVNAAQ